MSWLCRDCLTTGFDEYTHEPCPNCRSTRVISHTELSDLTIAHIDCDAFYATIEKRDHPSIRNKPVLVGGQGSRGVIMAACYVARQFGCRSAMPMFKARKLCPDAIVIRPNMSKYSDVGRDVLRLMRETTPLVEPISIDEAFLDLSGTEKLHKGSAARTLAALAQRIETKIKITVSVGLSHNKFLAKLASGLNKPRGFSVIGERETLSYLTNLPVNKLWGVGKALQGKLQGDGFMEIGDLRNCSEEFLIRRYGSIGRRLYQFSRGLDTRRVDPNRTRKSISSETTFSANLASLEDLKKRLWPLCENISARAKSSDLSGSVVTLKLKTGNFKTRTRSRTLTNPTQLAEVIWHYSSYLLELEATGTPFRLIGVGLSGLQLGQEGDPMDLADPQGTHRKKVENTMDQVRARFGADSILKGRTFSETSRPRKG